MIEDVVFAPARTQYLRWRTITPVISIVSKPPPSSCNQIFISRSLPVQLHGSCCPRSTEQILTEAPHHPPHGEVCCLTPNGWRSPGDSHPFLVTNSLLQISACCHSNEQPRGGMCIFLGFLQTSVLLQRRRWQLSALFQQAARSSRQLPQGSRPGRIANFRYSISGTNAETFSRRSE